jgi:hypothetical protein
MHNMPKPRNQKKHLLILASEMLLHIFYIKTGLTLLKVTTFTVQFQEIQTFSHLEHRATVIANVKI